MDHGALLHFPRPDLLPRGEFHGWHLRARGSSLSTAKTFSKKTWNPNERDSRELTVTGYWCTVALIDAIQMIGFFFMFALAIPYHQKENRIGFVVMYSLTFFFGPNATTFMGYRRRQGSSGFGFLYLDPKKTDAGYSPGIGVKNTLIVLGVINLLGLLCTFLVPEAKGKSFIWRE